MPLLLLAFVTGCAPGPIGAPYGSGIEVPGSQTFTFDTAYNTPNDSIGMLVFGQILVTNPDGEASNGIFTEITSFWDNAYVIPAGAVEVVDDYQTACEGDGSDECNAWFDTATDRYVEFGGEYQDLGGYRPTYLSTASDNRGLVDFYIFIDSVPTDDTGAAIPIGFYASIGVASDTWSVEFQ